jgi:hypothetical protein
VVTMGLVGLEQAEDCTRQGIRRGHRQPGHHQEQAASAAKDGAIHLSSRPDVSRGAGEYQGGHNGPHAGAMCACRKRVGMLSDASPARLRELLPFTHCHGNPGATHEAAHDPALRQDKGGHARSGVSTQLLHTASNVSRQRHFDLSGSKTEPPTTPQ